MEIITYNIFSFLFDWMFMFFIPIYSYGKKWELTKRKNIIEHSRNTSFVWGSSKDLYHAFIVQVVICDIEIESFLF